MMSRERGGSVEEGEEEVRREAGGGCMKRVLVGEGCGGDEYGHWIRRRGGVRGRLLGGGLGNAL